MSLLLPVTWVHFTQLSIGMIAKRSASLADEEQRLPVMAPWMSYIVTVAIAALQISPLEKVKNPSSFQYSGLAS